MRYLSPKGIYWILKYKNTLELLRAGTKTLQSDGALFLTIFADKETCVTEASAF